MSLSLFRGSLVLPDTIIEDGLLAVDKGRICFAGPQVKAPYEDVSSAVAIPGGYIAPGFVDIHVHGGAGADYMDGSLEAIRASNRAHAHHGTTTLFATTTTGQPEQISRMLEGCISCKTGWTIGDGARIGGVHYYGPYFAEDKVGCHSVEGRRDPCPEEYKACFDLGIIQVATCAAELPGATAFYRSLRARLPCYLRAFQCHLVADVGWL